MQDPATGRHIYKFVSPQQGKLNLARAVRENGHIHARIVYQLRPHQKSAPFRASMDPKREKHLGRKEARLKSLGPCCAFFSSTTEGPSRMCTWCADGKLTVLG